MLLPGIVDTDGLALEPRPGKMASQATDVLRYRVTVSAALFPGMEELLRLCDALTASIRRLEHEVESLGRERYPETQLLRQVPGIGPITSLAPFAPGGTRLVKQTVACTARAVVGGESGGSSA
jgi:hypothetical protein